MHETALPMQTLQSYAQRTIDVGLFGNVPHGPDRTETLSLALLTEERPATIVAGKQRLLQRVWLEFTTEAGSMTFLPERGCHFFSDLRKRRPRTPAELFAMFASAAEEVRTHLQAEETEHDPPDERLKALRISQAILRGNRLEFIMEVEAQDGGLWQFIVPVPAVL